MSIGGYWRSNSSLVAPCQQSSSPASGLTSTSQLSSSSLAAAPNLGQKKIHKEDALNLFKKFAPGTELALSQPRIASPCPPTVTLTHWQHPSQRVYRNHVNILAKQGLVAHHRPNLPFQPAVGRVTREVGPVLAMDQVVVFLFRPEH